MAMRVCLVTGAGQGIGRAIALGFGAAGYRVVAADLNAKSAAAVAAEIAAAGGQAMAATVDITDARAVRDLVEQAKSRFGGCDILINNARWSGLAPKSVQDITDDEWRRALDVNVTGAFHCIRAVVPVMMASGWGRIVTLSSATTRRPPTRPYAHYITTKAALIGLTRAVAQEVGRHGITVNAILPGTVETGVARPGGIDTAARLERVMNSQAIPRVLAPKDIIGAALFLASDASEFITGQSLAVDGGFSFG